MFFFFGVKRLLRKFAVDRRGHHARPRHFTFASLSTLHCDCSRLKEGGGGSSKDDGNLCVGLRGTRVSAIGAIIDALVVLAGVLACARAKRAATIRHAHAGTHEIAETCRCAFKYAMQGVGRWHMVSNWCELKGNLRTITPPEKAWRCLNDVITLRVSDDLRLYKIWLPGLFGFMKYSCMLCGGRGTQCILRRK